MSGGRGGKSGGKRTQRTWHSQGGQRPATEQASMQQPPWPGIDQSFQSMDWPALGSQSQAPMQPQAGGAWNNSSAQFIARQQEQQQLQPQAYSLYDPSNFQQTPWASGNNGWDMGSDLYNSSQNWTAQEGPVGSSPISQRGGGNWRSKRRGGGQLPAPNGNGIATSNASNDSSNWRGSNMVSVGSDTATHTSSASTSQQRKACHAWSQGRCTFGDRCKFAHENSQGNYGGFSSGGAVGSRADAERNAVDPSAGEGNAKGGGGKGKRKGKASGAWGDGLPRHVKISKTLTQILRHKAVDLGIEIDAAGWCKTEDVLAAQWMRELNCTVEDVENVTKKSDKQRFEVSNENEVHRVRAVQGHSIEGVEDDEALERLTEDSDLPDICVHGTYHRYIKSILHSGLKPGGNDGSAFRKHVHFAPFNPGDKNVISGMRYDAEVGIWLNLRKAVEAGIPFYISPNKVILSPGKNGSVGAEFFEKVLDLQTKQPIPLSPASF